jgi:hypothetical protein
MGVPRLSLARASASAQLSMAFESYRMPGLKAAMLRRAQPTERGRTYSEPSTRQFGAGLHAMQDGALEFGIVPFTVLVVRAHANTGFPGGRAGTLGGAGMKGIAHDVGIGCRHRHRHQLFGIARQQWRERDPSLDSGTAQLGHDGEALSDGRAEWFVQTPHAVVIRSHREADAQPGAFTKAQKQVEVAKNQRTAGLNGEHCRWTFDQPFQDRGHVRSFAFSRLIRVDQRRAVDDLCGAQCLCQEVRGIGFKCGELAPAPPVLWLESALKPHGGDVTIGAGEGAVARGSQRVSKSGGGNEARGRGQYAASLRFADL